MEPIWLAVVMFALGAALVAAELILPGGVLGVAGGVAIAVGVVACFFHSQAAGAIAMLSLLVLGPAVGWLWVMNAHRTPGARSLFLAGTADASGAPQPVVRPGEEGVTVSELRPGGVCEVRGVRVSCQCETGMIAAGTPVQVVAFADGRAVVRTIAAA